MINWLIPLTSLVTAFSVMPIATAIAIFFGTISAALAAASGAPVVFVARDGARLKAVGAEPFHRMADLPGLLGL